MQTGPSREGERYTLWDHDWIIFQLRHQINDAMTCDASSKNFCLYQIIFNQLSQCDTPKEIEKFTITPVILVTLIRLHHMTCCQAAHFLLSIDFYAACFSQNLPGHFSCYSGAPPMDNQYHFNGLPSNDRPHFRQIRQKRVQIEGGKI